MKLRTFFLIAPSLLAAIALSACSTTSGKGGVTGFLSSSAKPAASTRYIAALDGGIVGRTGIKLSDNDKQRALEAEYRALETAPLGQPVAWTGKNVNGEVVAAAPIRSARKIAANTPTRSPSTVNRPRRGALPAATTTAPGRH